MEVPDRDLHGLAMACAQWLRSFQTKVAGVGRQDSIQVLRGMRNAHTGFMPWHANVELLYSCSQPMCLRGVEQAMRARSVIVFIALIRLRRWHGVKIASIRYGLDILADATILSPEAG